MVIGNPIQAYHDFEAFIDLPENRDKLFELVHGEIVEKMPTEEHGAIAAKLIMRIGIFVEQHKLGRITVESRYKMPKDDQNARLPDVAFTGQERLLPLVRADAVPQMPDLAIEIKSPTDTFKEMREKADYYLENGSRMVWLIYPSKQIIEIHTSQSLEILNNQDTIFGGDVLPNFELSIQQVFDV